MPPIIGRSTEGRKRHVDLAKQRARNMKWRARNSEKLKEYFRNYYATHPEAREYRRQYYQKHKHLPKKPLTPGQIATRKARNARQKDKINAWRREWRRKNLEHVREIERRNRVKHREAKLQRDAEYRRRNPDVYKASIERSKKAKPELYRNIASQSNLNRRARFANVPIERVSVGRVYERDGNRCHLCGLPIERGRSLDHLIPIVRGGAHTEWNLMAAHSTCNQSRGTKQILQEETKAAAMCYVAQRLAERAA